MPVKNGGKYLTSCVESILSQSFNDWELIVVNDHSEDDTAEILAKYSVNDSRIAAFNNPRKGIVNALEFGLLHCCGDFVSRMDSDDIMPEHRLATMIQALEKSSNGTIVTGLVEYIGAAPISEGYQIYEQWLNHVNLSGSQWDNIYRECTIASPNWIIRREDLIKSGGFADLEYPEDYDLVFRWYQSGFKVKCLPQITLFWREHSERTSRNSENYTQQAFFELKIKRFIELELNYSTLVLWGKNAKTKLVRGILERSNIPFHLYDLRDYKHIEQYPTSKLLVGVYPSESERQKLESYLDSIGRSVGKDWWYL
ncbi:MAG: glycosyltransferase family 2 protein [Cyclobacteriaceae bacterium]